MVEKKGNSASQTESQFADMINALAYGDKPQEQYLTPDVVLHFNRLYGGKLPSETRLEDLKIPNSTAPQSYRLWGTISKVSPPLRTTVNAAISLAMREFDTVGELREKGNFRNDPRYIKDYFLSRGFTLLPAEQSDEA